MQAHGKPTLVATGEFSSTERSISFKTGGSFTSVSVIIIVAVSCNKPSPSSVTVTTML